ncbi:MAG: zinc ABC transporter substrate-binding protein [Dehalococcoidales bacterium]|nr:zinc ABC transporter substrate-binding protein [Dehalococcoidales bacterium]
MTKTIVLSLLLLVVSPILSSCTPETAAAERLGVVVTLPPLADFVEKVGGDKVTVSIMVPPGANPHTYEPTPSQMVNVSKSQVYVKVGTGVEFELVWMDKILNQNRELVVIDCSDGVALRNNDPHIWNSPVLAQNMVTNIAEGLARVDAPNSAYYRDNTTRYLRELDALDQAIQEKFAGYANRNFIVYHPAFGYLAADYRLTEIAIEQEGHETTPRGIQESIDLARQLNIRYIFVAEQFPTMQAEAIAREIGGEIVFLNSLPRDYIAGVRSVVDAISAELEQD